MTLHSKPNASISQGIYIRIIPWSTILSLSITPSYICTGTDSCCYVFFGPRKEKLTPPLNFSDYKAWLGSAPAGAASVDQTPMPILQQSNTAGVLSTNNTGDISKSSEEPAYPSSFAQIVELITTGQPIPGIQQIPDTVLTGHATPSKKPKRRKPWEKGTGNEDLGI